MAPKFGAEGIGGHSRCGLAAGKKKGVRPRAELVCYLNARQPAQGNDFFSASLLSFLDDTHDWVLVVEMKGHGKYLDMIQRSR